MLKFKKLLLFIILASLISSCQKDPIVTQGNNDGNNHCIHSTFDKSEIVTANMPASFQHVNCPGLFGNILTIYPDSIENYFCSLNPSDKSEMLFAGVDQYRRTFSLYKFDFCNGKTVKIYDNFPWQRAIWNSDGYIYFKQNNDIVRLNDETLQLETFIEDGWIGKHACFNPSGTKLLTDIPGGLFNKVGIMDVAQKKIIDTIDYLPGKRFWTTENDIYYFENTVKHYSIKENRVIQTFPISFSGYDYFSNYPMAAFNECENRIYYSVKEGIYKLDLITGVQIFEPHIEQHTFGVSLLDFHEQFLIRNRHRRDTIGTPDCYENYRVDITFEDINTGIERRLKLHER